MTGTDWFVVAVFVVLAVARPLHLFRGRSRRIKGWVERPWLQPLQLFTFYAIIGGSLTEYFLLERSLMWPLIVFALAVIVLTKGLKEWAISALGLYWSPHVELRPNQPVIDSGPYAFMRHPSYLNGIAEGLCVPILCSSWYTLVLAIVVTFLVFKIRISTEEETMKRAIGDKYKDYCSRVSRFAGLLDKLIGELLGGRYFWVLLLMVVLFSLVLLTYYLKTVYQWGWFNIGEAIIYWDWSYIQHNPVKGHTGPHHRIDLHQVLYEGISILGVSISILTAGLAIATPLYLTLWQSMSDSLFALDREISVLLKNTINDDDEKKLRKHRDKVGAILEDFENKVNPARWKLRVTLLCSSLLLTGAMLIIAVPLEGFMYVGYTIITCLAIAVGLMFIHIIFEVTEMSPVKTKLKIQSSLLRISKTIDAPGTAGIPD